MIFCHHCSNNQTPLPSEQLLSPVRVCDDCIRQIKKSNEADEILEHNAADADSGHAAAANGVETAQEAELELANHKTTV